MATVLMFGSVWIANPTYAETIVEYLTPTAESSPAGLNFDSKGNLWFSGDGMIWFTEVEANKIGKRVP